MEKIYEPNDSFDFSKLNLLSPSSMPGGNYFIKFRINDNPLYIQPPKCVSKSDILKSGKKHYCDLMFSNENEDFIRWMENLENYCQKKIFEHRSKWFETELDEHDIENSFTSPLKIFKSGKFYISRTNVPTMLGKCSLKIYNEDEHEVDIETIKENTNVITILEIQGIKCSSKNFQIEIEIKQMMVFKENNLFEKCIFTQNNARTEHSSTLVVESDVHETPILGMNVSFPTPSTSFSPDTNNGFPPQLIEDFLDDSANAISSSQKSPIFIPDSETNTTPGMKNGDARDGDGDFISDREDVKDGVVLAEPSATMLCDLAKTEQIKTNEIYSDSKDILEVNMNIDDLPNDDTIFIKKRNDIYYQMYKEAKRKAKMARDLAISSYLEAKHIKNTYMLENEDSDSDFDEESFDNIE